MELAARHGVEVKPEEAAARYRFTNFAGFIETFKWVTSFLREPEDYALITRSALRGPRAAKRGLRRDHAFGRRDAAAHAKRGSEFRGDSRSGGKRGVQPASHGVDSGRDATIRAGRGAGSGEGCGETGAGGRGRVWHGRRRTCVSGGEFPARVRLGAPGRAATSFATPGEIGGPESVREAVEILGAERVGHGIAVMNDPALADCAGDAARGARKLHREQCGYGRAGEADGQGGRVVCGSPPGAITGAEDRS